MAKTIDGVDALKQIAESGVRKLNARERRRVMVYMNEIGEGWKSTAEYAKLFKVSESTIKDDKRLLLTTLTDTLTPEHAMAFVGDHVADINYLIAVAKRGLRTQNPGDLGETRYIDSITKLVKERRETLENIGVIRKELGHMSLTEENWVATVDKDSGVCDVKKDTPTPSL